MSHNNQAAALPAAAEPTIAAAAVPRLAAAATAPVDSSIPTMPEDVAVSASISSPKSLRPSQQQQRRALAPVPESESAAIATATPSAATAAASAQSSDARMIAKQTAYIAQQKAKIEEWRRTVSEYKAWHERSVAALKARHQRDQQKQAAQLAQAQKELAERDERIERMEKEARRMRLQLQRHEEKAQAALDDTVTSDAEEEEEDADSVSHLNSSGSGSDSSFDSPDSPRQGALAVAVQEQETSSSLVRAGSSDTQLAPLSAFPRALTVADNASVDEHVTNLFAQVSALRGRLAGLKRTVAAPIVSARSTISSSSCTSAPLLPLGLAGEADLGAAAADDHQPQLRQHARTESTSTASLEAGPDGCSAPVLNFNTTTESLVSTASLLSSDKAADGAAPTRSGSGGDGESVELSVSRQITSLASRSSSFDAFAREVGAHVAAYHTTIHRLTAQVEHLQARGARAETEAAEQMAAVQSKDEQLREVQQLLRRFIAQMHEAQKDFTAAGAPDAAAGTASDPDTFPLHFFATLHAYLRELSEQHRLLAAGLRASEDCSAALRAQLQAERAGARERVVDGDKERLRLQEQVNMLQMVIDTERRHGVAAVTAAPLQLHPTVAAAGAVPAPALAQARAQPAVPVQAAVASAYTVLPNYSSSASIVIPHLPLHRLLPQSAAPILHPLSVHSDSDSDDDDDDSEIEILHRLHEEEEKTNVKAAPTAAKSSAAEVTAASLFGPSAAVAGAKPRIQLQQHQEQQQQSHHHHHHHHHHQKQPSQPQSQPQSHQSRSVFLAGPPPQPAAAADPSTGALREQRRAFTQSSFTAPSVSGSARTAASATAHSRNSSVSAASAVSGSSRSRAHSKGAGASASLIPSPSSAFSLVMRTPFACGPRTAALQQQLHLNAQSAKSALLANPNFAHPPAYPARAAPAAHAAMNAKRAAASNSNSAPRIAHSCASFYV